MKTKVEKVNIYGHDRYISRFKKHFWNRWTYVNDPNGNVPYLFNDYQAAELAASAGCKDFNINDFI